MDVTYQYGLGHMTMSVCSLSILYTVISSYRLDHQQGNLISHLRDLWLTSVFSRLKMAKTPVHWQVCTHFHYTFGAITAPLFSPAGLDESLEVALLSVAALLLTCKCFIVSDYAGRGSWDGKQRLIKCWGEGRSRLQTRCEGVREWGSEGGSEGAGWVTGSEEWWVSRGREELGGLASWDHGSQHT